MGSLFKPKVPAAPPPPPDATVDNFKSDITGVTRNRVKNPDGSYTIVESQSLTPEQQAQNDKLKALQTQNLDRYNQLANNYDISAIPGLSDAVNAYKQTNQIALDQGYNDATRQSEQQLARYGVTNSTAANETRGQIGASYMNDKAQLGRDAYSMEQQVRQQQMGDSLNMYNLATGAINTDQANAVDSLNRGMQNQDYLSGLSQQKNMAVYQGALANQQMRFQANAAQQQTMGMLAGMAIGGATGGFGGGGGMGLSQALGSPSMWSSSPMSASRSSQLGITWDKSKY